MVTPNVLYKDKLNNINKNDNKNVIVKIRKKIKERIFGKWINKNPLNADENSLHPKKCKNVKIFLTEDKELLKQYFNLRNDIFQSERGWIKKTWYENDFDRQGRIIIATDQDKVVGGIRIMISTQGEKLSGEIANTKYTYPNLFRQMNVPVNKKYAELDGLIVAKEYRDRSVTEKILARSIEYALSFDCSYLIGIALLPYCKIYQGAYKAIGYNNVHIVKDFMWSQLEEYNYSKDYPIVNVIQS